MASCKQTQQVGIRAGAPSRQRRQGGVGSHGTTGGEGGLCPKAPVSLSFALVRQGRGWEGLERGGRPHPHEDDVRERGHGLSARQPEAVEHLGVVWAVGAVGGNRESRGQLTASLQVRSWRVCSLRQAPLQELLWNRAGPSTRLPTAPVRRGHGCSQTAPGVRGVCVQAPEPPPPSQGERVWEMGRETQDHPVRSIWGPTGVSFELIRVS